MQPFHEHVCGVVQESAFFKELKAASPFFLMAGPNVCYLALISGFSLELPCAAEDSELTVGPLSQVVESEEHCLKMARQIKAGTDALQIKLVFKASFDKANRTSAASFRGPGLEEGLRY